MTASGHLAGQSSSAVVVHCRQHGDLVQASAHTGLGLQMDEHSVHGSAQCIQDGKGWGQIMCSSQAMRCHCMHVLSQRLHLKGVVMTKCVCIAEQEGKLEDLLMEGGGGTSLHG